MNASIKEMLADKIIVGCLSITGFILLFHIFFVVYFFSKLPPFIPIFNQMPWGDTRIALKPYIALPILITLVIGLVNIGMSIFLYKKIPLISRFLTITWLLISLLTILITIRTILISL